MTLEFKFVSTGAVRQPQSPKYHHETASTLSVVVYESNTEQVAISFEQHIAPHISAFLLLLLHAAA